MFYKLSNTTNLLDIEAAFDVKFKFPLLFKKTPIINGLYEQTVPVITMKHPEEINYAIWGLLPQDYKDEWENFQNITNTLNISINELPKLHWLENFINTQRCVIIVSGFFASYLHEGEIYPYYVHKKDNRPFALAGVYSRLDDGFLSVGLVLSNSQRELTEIHNLGKDFPVALSSNNYRDWLKEDYDFLNNGLKDLEPVNLIAHTISKEFYKNNIIYDSVLEPAQYNNLPIQSKKFTKKYKD